VIDSNDASKDIDETKDSEADNKADEDILRIARERFDLAEEAEIDIRKDAIDDLEFRAGNQWPEAIKQEREQDNRPCLVINRIPQAIRQVTNDQRQNRPSIKVSPVDDNADIETARVLQGLVRHIELDSNADIAYDTGFEGSATKGIGYWRIIADYEDPMSFDQRLLIKRIRNSFTVYLDPHSQEPDGSDANWGFVFEDIPHEDYKAQFGKSKLAEKVDLEGWRSIGDQAPAWVSDKTCRVADYYYKSYEEKTIVKLKTGEVFEKSTMPEVLPPGVEIVDERKTLIPTINHCQINGYEILAKTKWPGSGRWIPIIPVIGDELDINGKRILEGIVRHAKAPQQMLNFHKSNEAETIALAPRAPYMVAEGQISEEYAYEWDNANRKNFSRLTYKPTDHMGQLVPPPQRNVYEPAIQAITMAGREAAEDIKATTGLYDDALGNSSNEKSGIAIQRRAHQSQTSNYHLIDNQTRSIRHTGRILVDSIPYVYDAERTIRIIGEEGQEEIIKINQMFDYKGEQRKFRFDFGKYDVAVETGPNFATKRQEAVATMLDLSRTAPQLMQYAGDLMVKSMDIPGSSEIAERIKKTLPPGIAEDDGKDKKPIPPQVQAQLSQLMQQNEQLVSHLKEATQVINTKTNELESKERIEFAKLENNLVVEQMKLQGAAANLVFAEELQNIRARLGLLDMNEPIDQDFNGAGPEGAVIPQEQQQPTGGLPPGEPMGV
jgi:hypothetical protein